MSIWKLLNSAYGTIWALIALSVLAMTVALERVWVLWGFMDRARQLHDTVIRCLSRGALEEGRSACERSKSLLADVYLVGYERLGRSKPENVDNAVHRERTRVAAHLRKRLWFLGTVGAAAPFVGLFGTVVGILDAFRELQRAEAAGETGVGVVAGPIAEALYATAFGLGIAVIAVMAFNYFQQRLGSIAAELKMLSDEFLEQLHEAGPENRTGHTSGADGDKGDTKGDTKEGKDGARTAA